VMTGDFPEMRRWGIKAAPDPTHPRRAVLFGGWDSRQQYNDLHIIERAQQGKQRVVLRALKPEGTPPSHRAGHSMSTMAAATTKIMANILKRSKMNKTKTTTAAAAAAAAKSRMLLVFGGSACVGGPYRFYNDLHALLLNKEGKCCWHRVETTGVKPSARAQHAAVTATLSNGHPALVIVGGYNGEEVLNDVYSLDLSTLVWTRHNTTGHGPEKVSFDKEMPNFSVFPAQACACTLGRAREHVLVHSPSGTHVLNTGTWSWHRVAKKGEKLGQVAAVNDGVLLLMPAGLKGEQHALVRMGMDVVDDSSSSQANNSKTATTRDNRYGRAHARYCKATRRSR